MYNSIKKENIVANLFWRFAERSGAQLVSFIVSIVLARMLDPNLFGTVAILYVFIEIVQVFVDSGLGNALIQKKNADDLDFSSVFYVNLILCISMYGLLFVLAPIIAGFYNDNTMISMIRVLGLTVVISGVKNIQQAYVSRHLMFKKFFYATLGGTICAGIVGISMAYNGMGAWALVAQQITNVVIDTCVLWGVVKWHPKRMFSFERLKELYSYGWKLLVSSLIDTGYNNLRSLIIGKLYTSTDLAYYDRGEKLPTLVIANILASIDSVLLPAMSEVQDVKERVKEMCRRSTKTSVYILAPCMIGLFSTAEPLVRIMLTEKWMNSVFYIRVFCITLIFYPVHTANLSAIKAVGKSDIFLKLEIVKKIIGIIILICAMRISVKAMAVSTLISTIISLLLNSYPNKKLLNYGFSEQIRDIIPSITLATAMGSVVYLISMFQLPDIVTLVIQIVVGISVYVGGSKLLRMDPYEYIMTIIRNIIRKRRGDVADE